MLTDFLVRADGPRQRLEDTFGGIAYSTKHSHSGYNAARYHLLRCCCGLIPRLTAIASSFSTGSGRRRLRVARSAGKRLAHADRL